jgi:hypothetical protein
MATSVPLTLTAAQCGVECVNKVMSTVQKLHQIWDEIGLNEIKKKEKESEILRSILEEWVNITFNHIQQEQQKATLLQDEITTLLRKVNSITSQTGFCCDELISLNSPVGVFPLLQRKAIANDILDKATADATQRQNQFNSIRQKIITLSAEMSIPITPLPTNHTDESLSAITTTLHKLEEERNNILIEVKERCRTIKGLWKEVCVCLSPKIRHLNFCVTLFQLGVTPSDQLDRNIVAFKISLTTEFRNSLCEKEEELKLIRKERAEQLTVFVFSVISFGVLVCFLLSFVFCVYLFVIFVVICCNVLVLK